MKNHVEGRQWHRAAVAICCGIALVGCAGRPDYVSDTLAAQSARPDRDAAAEIGLGIRLEGLRLSAAGDMLDFRYRVIDPAKAAPLLDGKIMPYLLDESSGAQLGGPDTATPGSILFANPGRSVQAGSRMTLMIGDLRIGNLTVE
ncbi:MAG TPA: hypothetical protein VFF26_02480 [Gallionella sp.]|nr:hypothetical protein [Gallionella sp.]